MKVDIQTVNRVLYRFQGEVLADSTISQIMTDLRMYEEHEKPDYYEAKPIPEDD